MSMEDHIRTIERGLPATTESIAAFEAQLGTNLPGDYRQLLLELGWAILQSNEIDIATLADGGTDVFEIFGLSEDVESRCLPWNLREFRQRYGKVKSVPFGRDSYGNPFCLSIDSKSYGEIHFCDYLKDGYPAHFVARSPSDFFSKIQYD
jgi:cell wall assembly regulator SMI1